MTISNIKELICSNHKLNPMTTSFIFTPQVDKDKSATGWHSTWEPTNRLRVVLHQDTLAAIQQDKLRTDLLLKAPELVSPEGGTPYLRYCIIIPANVSLSI